MGGHKRIIIFWGIIAFAGGLFFGRFTPERLTSALPIGSNSKPSEQGFDEFVNKKYGFSFKYPRGIMLKEESDESIVLLSDIPEKTLTFSVKSEKFDKPLQDSLKWLNSIYIQAPKAIINTVEKGTRVDSLEGKFNLPLELGSLKIKSIFTHPGLKENSECSPANPLGYSLSTTSYYAHYETFYFPLQGSKVLQVTWEDSRDSIPQGEEDIFPRVIDTIGTGILLTDCKK